MFITDDYFIARESVVIANRFINESKLSPITPAHEEVAGMRFCNLQYNYDFKREVRRIVDDCAADVDGSDGSISC